MIVSTNLISGKGQKSFLCTPFSEGQKLALKRVFGQQLSGTVQISCVYNPRNDSSVCDYWIIFNSEIITQNHWYTRKKKQRSSKNSTFLCWYLSIIIPCFFLCFLHFPTTLPTAFSSPVRKTSEVSLRCCGTGRWRSSGSCTRRMWWRSVRWWALAKPGAQKALWGPGMRGGWLVGWLVVCLLQKVVFLLQKVCLMCFYSDVFLWYVLKCLY